jgi:transcriptional regulator with XRE-family HTH domain
MSRHHQSKLHECQLLLGEWLRELRRARKLPLRAVAAAAEMDSTLLSKIELGQRLPTEAQCKSLATFFSLATEELEAKRIAERFWAEHQSNPATARALSFLISRPLHNRFMKNGDGV